MKENSNLILEIEELNPPISDGSTGVEEEIQDSDVTLIPIKSEEFFNPAQIRVSNKIYSLDSFLERIANEEIELQPDFQRQAGIWSSKAKSRLIESLLVRIPLPAFYIDATHEDKWRVIDGLQRLTTLKEFVLDQEFALRDLEIMQDFIGKTYAELPRPFQRRIKETQLTVVQIEAGTPEEAVFAIFRRINTGGLPLSSQEIRHALFAGQSRELLAELAKSNEFLKATSRSIRDSRMADREFVLRALAFMMTPYKAYQSEDLDGFLNKQMKALNKASVSEIEALKIRFARAMKNAYTLFERKTFRKIMPGDKGLNPVNRALFEVWAVTLDSLTDAEIEQLIKKKEKLDVAWHNLMQDESFYRSISQSTGSGKSVKRRFEGIENMVLDVLEIKQGLTGEQL